MTGSSWRPSWTRPFVEEPFIPNTHRDRSYWTLAALCLTSFVGSCLQAVAAPHDAYGIGLTVGWLLVFLVFLVQRPRYKPLLEIVLTLILAALQVIILLNPPLRPQSQRQLDVCSLLCTVLALILLFNMPLRDPDRSDKGIAKYGAPPSSSVRSPEDNLTLLQWMTVSWFAPLLRLGSARKLEPTDVWSLPYDFQHSYLHEAFRTLQGSVVRRLVKANWIDLVYISFWALIELGGNYSAPVVLQKLLQAMQHIAVDKQPAIKWALVALLLRYLTAQSGVFGLWYSRRAYERSRGEMITMIYQKTLNRKIQGGLLEDEKVEEPADRADTEIVPAVENLVEEAHIAAGTNHQLAEPVKPVPLSSTSRLHIAFAKVTSLFRLRNKPAKPQEEKSLPATTGKILNIMRNDVYEVSQRFWEFNDLLDQPIGLAVSFSLVWRLLGWPCLFGVAVIILAQGLNAILAKVLISWETKRRKATDDRLQKIAQYIEAIRHLRYYAWQDHWLVGIMTARQKELNLKIITGLWDMAILLVNTLGAGMLPVASFWAFTTLKGDKLTVDIAFPALQLFQLLQSDLRSIPRLITTLLNAAVAVRRIESFMQEPDKEDGETAGQRFGAELETKNATFAWPGKKTPVLKNISISFPDGLSVVFGPVASGKTALLQALLGELDIQAGEIVRPETAVAYCAQTPWLQSMTIRDNIIFNGAYDETRYKEALHACALVTDLAAFEHGDLSPIGENGIGLSGGQKMRVALARAVYSHADTLLLDDPLSALDQQTAEHIVRHCLTGPILRGRTVILVTHRVDLCAKVGTAFIEIQDGTATTTSSLPEDEIKNMLSPEVSRQADVSDSESEAKKDEAAAVPEKFEEEETRAHGGVPFKVYWEYIRAGRFHWWVLLMLSTIAGRLFVIGQSWYLKEWSEAYHDVAWTSIARLQKTILTLGQSTPLGRFFERFPDPTQNPKPWLLGLMFLVLFETVLFVTTTAVTIVISYVAGKRMFRDAMTKISKTPFRYYDVTPVGRLMNRLTSDVGTVDGRVSDILMYCLWNIVSWMTSVAVIATVAPAFLVAVIILTSTFVYIFSKFIPTSQSLRRLEMVSLSPLMSNFGALLEGLMTVRAFGVQKQFQDRIIVTTDAFQGMDHFYWSIQTWLMFRFDLLSATSTFVLTLLAIYSNLAPGLTAFVLISAAKFVQSTHGLCRSYGRLQLDFVAVERVVELLNLEGEEAGDVSPPASWPSTTDDIVFEGVTIRYAPHLDPALKSLNFTIPSGSNTAVVGRTGSGKSTMALALLAATPPDIGRITIGGIDIHRVSKHILRSRITFLAQDPVLFPGTLRHNLDPVSEHSDEECADVLERVCGKYGFELDTQIDTGGKNLSQGQRQLVGLARAILRRSAVIIMDEATASIDRQTAWDIQRVLKEELVGSTVVTIAHRHGAVRDAKLVLRLKAGEVEYFGPPVDEGGSQAGSSGRA